MGTNLRKKTQLAFEAKIAMEKKELEDKRASEQMQLAKSGNKDAYSNVMMPNYKYDERLKIEREF